MSRPASPEQYEPSWQEPDWVECETCHGDGRTDRDQYGLTETCPDCDGDGGREL